MVEMVLGVFTPLFAKYNDASEVTVLVTILLVMTSLWCIVTYYFVNHRVIARRIKYLGNILAPFVLIGVGMYIPVDSLFCRVVFFMN